MKALSLTQPWAWIILNLGKRIENRSRNIGNYRGPLLLHASKRMTPEDYWAAWKFVENAFGTEVAERIPPSDRLYRGGIIGRCRVVDSFGPEDVSAYARAHGALHGECDMPLDEPPWPDDQERWYMGMHAWILSDVQPVPFVKCPGSLGFWTVPETVVQLVDELEKVSAMKNSLGALR